MIPLELVEVLQGIDGVVVRKKEPLAGHLPLRLGGPVDAWVTTFTEAALVEVLRMARKHTVGVRIHWPFQDWIVREGGLSNLVVRPGGELERIWIEGDVLWIGAAATWASAAPQLVARGQAGLACWSGVPGTLLETAERSILKGVLVAVRRIRSGRAETIAVDAETGVPEITAPSVALAVGLSTVKPKRSPPAPGRLFADPPHDTSPRVLAKCGIGGTRFRDWRLSAVEPGTLVQLGQGTSEDLALLVKAIQHQVDRERGVELETRIPVLGDRGESDRDSGDRNKRGGR